MRRWIFFVLAILIGISAGLVYGWMIQPIRYADTSLDTLRIDYKTDYALMIAEASPVGEDLDTATKLLAQLADAPVGEILSQVIAFAEKAGYAWEDIQLLKSLEDQFSLSPAAYRDP